MEHKGNDWLTIKQLEAEYGFTKRNQERLRQEKLIPFSKVGRICMYSRSAINQWLENHQVVGVSK